MRVPISFNETLEMKHPLLPKQENVTTSMNETQMKFLFILWEQISEKNLINQDKNTSMKVSILI
ncbi:MAG: hypothetical protein CMO81_11145 [Waddliaceae bacterium]|nr:hypothetical protein [Waddliaceae bacterium]|tara:strand:- start:282 stop:473 length:192 start_codon:yes stop_codon:yes gene_type:complete